MTEEDTSERIYKSNFLTNVIFRIDFPKILGLDKEKPPAEFQEKISDRFPISKEVEGGILGIHAAPDAVSIKQEKIVEWEFFNKERTKRVHIASNFLYVEYHKFNNFGELEGDMRFIFESFLELYPVKIVNSIGLRFINQINLESGDPMNWNDLIHPSLFSITQDFTSDEDEVLRSMHLLDIKENENKLRFQFGIFNSEYPNPIARKEFILDYDCRIDEELETSEVYRRAKGFYEIIHKWFEKSIEKGLREIMGGGK